MVLLRKLPILMYINVTSKL